MQDWWNQGWFHGSNVVEARQIKQTEESIFEEEENAWVPSDTLAKHFQPQ